MRSRSETRTADARNRAAAETNARTRATADAEARVRPDNDARVRADAEARIRARDNLDRPNLDRPNLDRPNLDRPATTWNRATRDDLQSVRARMNDAVRITNDERSLAKWDDRHPDRVRDWHDRGDAIRDHYRDRDFNDFRGVNWWRGRPILGFGYGPNVGWWGYQPWLGYRPYWYWWSRPTWGSVCGWFPGYGWNDPYYYDYGNGGNVIYTTNQVVVNEQVVGTPEDYAQSAAALADVDPSLIDPNDRDWMPLGTFSMAVQAGETDPARVLQLAVNKGGIISGTVYNRQSGNVHDVRGRVDSETQRVAFTIGKSRDVVLETGLYNLTRDETEVLVHFGQSQTSTYFLARLPEPARDEAADPVPPVSTEVPTFGSPPPEPADGIPFPQSAVRRMIAPSVAR